MSRLLVAGRLVARDLRRRPGQAALMLLAITAATATLEVLRLFDSLHAAGQTLVIVTHDARIAATADRMISMRDGVFIDETRLTGGTRGDLGALAGLDGLS